MSRGRNEVVRRSPHDYFSEHECLLIVEALQLLQAQKQAAQNTEHDQGPRAFGRPFEERDFGLSHINRLLQKFGVEQSATGGF